ncbi:MAG: DUF362 domain-containing protein [Chloroflexota bacterium]|nr:DUF362 domain-containing protein [Dehalococcoidia bacterium]MDW8252655.1 DUF362 domain-containing protein [Chloroflexota bacterium]
MIDVAIARLSAAQYPASPPYSPSERYPEYPFSDQSEEPNLVYAGVRELFLRLGYDQDRAGLPTWNPLGWLIEPGMTVVLKPNWVLSRHKEGKSLYAIVTHPAVLRAIADYCWIALRGRGRLLIADAPQYDCNFSELMEATRLPDVVEFYRAAGGPAVEILDLRRYWSRWKHFPSLLEPLPGDPAGSLLVDLGARSALYGKPHPEKLYGAVYHRQETIAHHRGARHEYELSRSILTADVVISVPKLKVHKKVGVTLNAKGLVGIATNKNYLVHYTLTPPSQGGDQYPDGLFNPLERALIMLERWMYDHLLAPRKRPLEYLHRSIYAIHNRTTRRLGLKVQEWKRQLDAGNWYGNDSAWRMTLDLLRAFLFADRDGVLCDTPQRRVFSVVDGVIGGDGCGPLTPDPVPAGVLLGGPNLLAVDIVATRLMGFDPSKVRVLSAALADPYFDFGLRAVTDIRVLTDDPAWASCLTDPSSRFLGFRPHPGWVGYLEVQDASAAVAEQRL